MKKLIVLLALCAAPLMANAESDYTLTPVNPENPQAAPSDIQPERNYHRSFNFGSVVVGQRRATDFVLGAGRFPIRVHAINVIGRFFDGNSNCPSILFPGQRCVIRAYYWPRQAGQHHGRLDMWVDNDSITVSLFGRAWGRGGGWDNGQN